MIAVDKYTSGKYSTDYLKNGSRNIQRSELAKKTPLEKIQGRFTDFETTYAAHDTSTIAYIERSIKEEIAALGKDLSALDPSGKSSNEQIQERFKRAAIRAHIVSARRQFDDFEKTDIAHDFTIVDHIASRIKAHIVAAHADFSILDPSGKNTTAQMEERLKKAASRANIITARKRFAEFETREEDSLYPEHVERAIRNSLSAAGADMSALDATGQSSAEQMESRFQQATVRGHILNARKEFAGLEATDEGLDVEFHEKEIRDSLATAGADMSALDPSGASSAERMEARLKQAVLRAHLAGARGSLVYFEEDHKATYALDDAKEHLTAAGGDMSALGAPGAKSPEQTAERLKRIADTLTEAFISSTMRVRPGGVRAVKPFKLQNKIGG